MLLLRRPWLAATELSRARAMHRRYYRYAAVTGLAAVPLSRGPPCFFARVHSRALRHDADRRDDQRRDHSGNQRPAHIQAAVADGLVEEVGQRGACFVASVTGPAVRSELNQTLNSRRIGRGSRDTATTDTTRRGRCVWLQSRRALSG